MKRRTIRYGVAGCIVALARAIIYTKVRPRILDSAWISRYYCQCIGFAAIAGILIYLTKKQKDPEEEDLFKINSRTSGRADIQNQS
jgi:hypothetical protein